MRLKSLIITKTMKKLKPAHPGKLLLNEFIKPMGLSVYRVAKDSGIAQSTLAAIVSAQRSISPETAMRLGLYFGVDAQFWLNLQTRYGLMMLDRRRIQIERQVHPLPKAA
jgi:addiction module HigA family antidote